MADMKPRRPYLLRALYEWIVDSECTPHLLVDAESEGVVVPQSFVQDGKIVLNVAPRAIQALDIDEAWVCFQCRFSGAPMRVELPIASVLAIYARESGEGMMFEAESQAVPAGTDGNDEATPDARSQRGPDLRVVK